MNIEKLHSRFDPLTAAVDGAPATRRFLGDLGGCFADTAAYDAALAVGNPLIYAVSSIEPGSGAGDLHCGVGLLMPGRVGSEYFMTRGHLHSWRDAAEIYIGLTGEGVMLLEDEQSGESHLLPLRPQHMVYVPGYTAHRTMNTGDVPLTYIGVYPAAAGHDYGAIARSNFRFMVVECEGQPIMIERGKQP